SGTFNVKKLDINSGAVANLSDITGGAPRVITSGTSNDVSILVTLAGAVPNTPPMVNAGPDQALRGTSVANLDGTVSDDALPAPPGALTIQWSKIIGPGAVVFGSDSAVDTTATVSQPGLYELRLSAYD